MPRRAADDDYADDIRETRRRLQELRRKDSHPATGYILGGLAAGIAAAVVGGGIWLMFRHPNESEAAKQAREYREAFDRAQEQHRRDGTNNLGDASDKLGEQLLREAEERRKKNR